MTTKVLESTGLNTRFEKEVCGRCGGSGRYSYNRIHGSLCYGCQGKGERLTKRGKAASAYLRQLMMKKACELQVGDLVRVSGVSLNGMTSYRYWGEVVSIVREEESRVSHKVDGEWIKATPSLKVTTAHNRMGEVTHIYGDDAAWMVKPPREDHVRMTDEAVAYQETLTKAGKARKRSKVEAGQ